MIVDKVYRLKEAADLGKGITFPKGQEIHIVTDVVYINGNILAPVFQDLIYKWVVSNPKLFTDDTRDW